MDTREFYQDDEINLADYLKVLARRRFTVLAVLFICTVGIITMIILTPKEYEASSIVRLGILSKPIYTIGDISAELNLNTIVTEIESLALDDTVSDLGNMVQVQEFNSSDFIKIKVRASSKLADKICNRLTNFIVTKGNEFYDQQLSSLNTKIQKLETSRSVVDLNRIDVLKREIIKSQRFKIVSPAVVSKYRIISKERVDGSLLIFISGLFLGVLIVSFQEFWQKNKRRDG